MAVQIKQGKPLTEMVKGSLDYTMHVIRSAFYTTFERTDTDWFWIDEIFADTVIVKHESQPPDEYFRVPYQRAGAEFTFAPRGDWEPVELAYQPATVAAMSESNRSVTIPAGEKTKLPERVSASIELVETAGKSDPDGPWRIKGLGITAGVVNGNSRRYAKHVLEAAVRDVNQQLQNSASQGRVILSGEADHPTDKGHRTALLQETIIKWDSISLDDSRVLISGNLIGTSLGKDVRAQMQAGIKPDISQRGYGRSVIIEENGQTIEEVTELVITGYDLVANGSDPNAGVTMFERQQGDQPAAPTKKEIETVDENTTTPQDLAREQQRLVEQYVKTKVAGLTRFGDAVRAKLEKSVLEAKPASTEAADKLIESRSAEYDAILGDQATRQQEIAAALGLDESADVKAELTRREAERQRLLDEDQKRQVAAFVESEAGKTKYPDWLRAQFVDAINAHGCKSIDEAKAVMAARRGEYDKIMAELVLRTKGRGVDVLGPVLERETGHPEFARPAYELVERLVERGLGKRRDFRAPKSQGERFAAQYLEAFDNAYRRQLLQESRMFAEAEQTSDLNLPYSVSRAIIEEYVPELVALSVFDFQLVDTSPTRIYFESYATESGAAPAITDESFTSDHDAWVSLAHKRLRAGSVVVTSSPAGTTYDEYDDFVVDYGNGKIMVLSTGAMADSTAFLIDYTYDSVREGELAAIQRGKGQLAYQTIELMADRLATQISDEAVTFARTQIGWDAQSRTIAMLIREIREMIDSHIFRLAIASAVRSANSGGSYTAASDTLDDLVNVLGLAKVAVKNDYHTPDAYVMSSTNAQKLSMWDGFKRDGFPDALLNSAGFVGMVNGLPVFESTEFPDNIALCANRELVQHRVLSSKPMSLKGPYPAYSSGSLVAAEEWYAEEYNATESLVVNKGGFITIA